MRYPKSTLKLIFGAKMKSMCILHMRGSQFSLAYPHYPSHFDLTFRAERGIVTYITSWSQVLDGGCPKPAIPGQIMNSPEGGLEGSRGVAGSIERIRKPRKPCISHRERCAVWGALLRPLDSGPPKLSL